MRSAGRNKRTHSLEISFEELSDKILYWDAMTPEPIVRSTASEAWMAPRKVVRIEEEEPDIVARVVRLQVDVETCALTKKF